MIDVVASSISHLGGVLSATLLGGVLSASLLGSFHCAGMCGPFVAIYAAGKPGSMKRSWLLHVAYHGARALSYVGFGAVFGALGRGLDLAGSFAGVSHFAALSCGLVVVVWGASVLLPRLRWRTPVARFFGPRLIKLQKKPPVVRASLLGGLTPLLPCGWLYAFLFVAAGTGSAASGALVMGTFWLGTVPALVGVGALVARLSDRFKARLPLLTGTALIVVGLIAIVHRMSIPLPVSAPPPGPEQAISVPGSEAKCH